LPTCAHSKKRLHSLKARASRRKNSKFAAASIAAARAQNTAPLFFARAKTPSHVETGTSHLAKPPAGGGSDGNFTAALGIPTLDGLGAVGDGAHATYEHIIVNAMPQRAALLAALLTNV